jgi:endonuclease YncB( thermonuclease family)
MNSGGQAFCVAVALAFAAGAALGGAFAPRLTWPAASAAEAKAVPLAEAGPVGTGVSYPADVLQIVDGDTFVARVSIWPGLETTTKVRLRGVDAPEMRARCAQEEARAIAARDRLAALLAQGDVAVAKVGLDKYGGRVLAAASTRLTPDVGAALLSAGVARPYQGGRRESWCGSSAG